MAMLRNVSLSNFPFGSTIQHKMGNLNSHGIEKYLTIYKSKP